jgi:uncharacterized membrane protein YfcA
MIAFALAASALAFVLSAAAGLGGSLILVPALSIAYGAKQGVALAAILLAGNNIAKLVAYRRTVPIRASSGVLALTLLGALLGAELLVRSPERVVQVAVVLVIVLGFAVERLRKSFAPRLSAGGLALLAGLTSGFSGTSGPLKGLALRRLELDRMHLVGAASAVSLVNDAAKSAVYLRAGLIDRDTWIVVLACVLLMPIATLVGRRINRQVGEVAYSGLFWAVMMGYTLRLLVR